jgi:hypothetical protein
MMMVTSGSEIEDVNKRKVVRQIGLWLSTHYQWVPLNGGSQSRRDMREHCLRKAMALRVPFCSTGFACRIRRRGRNRGWCRI